MTVSITLRIFTNSATLTEYFLDEANSDFTKTALVTAEVEFVRGPKTGHTV